MVAAEPLGAFNRDPNDLVLTVGGKLVVNHLLEHDFLSDIQLQSLLDDLDRVPLSEKAPIFNENPPIVGRPQDSGTRRTLYGNYGGANHHKHNPHKLHDLPVLKRVADCVLETAKKTVVGGVGWSCTILDMAEISSYDHTPQHLHRDSPHEALDVEALGASVATHVTDACRVLVEQAAATAVEAARAKGRSADHKSALAKAEKAQGNTQRALDQALNLAAKRGEEVEAMREALREAQEGRRKAEAEVEAAQLRVEVEGQRRRGDDLGQRLGVAEAQVRSLTSTLCASFGVQSQGSVSRSGGQ